MATGSQGTTVGVSTTTPATTYTDIQCVTNISKEDVEASTIDTTCLSATSKQKMLGLQDNGSVNLDLNVVFDDAGYVILQGLKTSGDKAAFEIKLPLAKGQTKPRSFTFDGYVKSLPWSAGVDAVITGTANIEIDGDVTEVQPTP